MKMDGNVVSGEYRMGELDLKINCNVRLFLSITNNKISLILMQKCS